MAAPCVAAPPFDGAAGFRSQRPPSTPLSPSTLPPPPFAPVAKYAKVPEEPENKNLFTVSTYDKHSFKVYPHNNIGESHKCVGQGHACGPLPWSSPADYPSSRPALPTSPPSPPCFPCSSSWWESVASEWPRRSATGRGGEAAVAVAVRDVSLAFTPHQLQQSLSRAAPPRTARRRLGDR